MTATSKLPASRSRLHRFFAAGAVLLVLALAAFAVSPTLHHWLHDGASLEDDNCAIALFSNGVSLPLDTFTVEVPSASTQTAALHPVSEIALVRARYLWQPERGPPVS